MNLKKRYIHILGGIALAALFGAIYYANNKEEAFSLSPNEFGFRLIEAREDKDEYLRSQMEICYKNGSDACYKKAAELFSYQFDYQELLPVLERTQNYPEVFARCHELTHFIGRKAFEANPSIKSLYETGSEACWGAFYHGVIEAYFGKQSFEGEEKFAEDIRKVCGDKKDYSVPRFFHECLHGIGHAMMFVSSGNLPKSLYWCDELKEKQNQETCYGGVFMENSSSSTRTGSGHQSKYIKADDPFFPCNILDEKYLDVCYRYQSSYFAQLVNFDMKKNAELCLQVPKAYQGGCFSIIGSNQVGNTQDSVKMKETCMLMPEEEARQYCIRGVVGGLTGRYVNKDKIIKAFCGTVPESLKKDCYKSMGVGFASWSADKNKALTLCEMENEEYKDWCAEGIMSSSRILPIAN